MLHQTPWRAVESISTGLCSSDELQQLRDWKKEMKKHTSAILLLAAILVSMTGSVMSKGIGCDDSYEPVHQDDWCPVEDNSGYDGPASFDEIFAGNPTVPVEKNSQKILCPAQSDKFP